MPLDKEMVRRKVLLDTLANDNLEYFRSRQNYLNQTLLLYQIVKNIKYKQEYNPSLKTLDLDFVIQLEEKMLLRTYWFLCEELADEIINIFNHDQLNRYNCEEVLPIIMCKYATHLQEDNIKPQILHSFCLIEGTEDYNPALKRSLFGTERSIIEFNKITNANNPLLYLKYNPSNTYVENILHLGSRYISIGLKVSLQTLDE